MKIFALILAGGQGSRMGGVDKGLVQWHNKALIDHVIEKNPPASQPYRHQCQPQSRILRPTQRARFLRCAPMATLRPFSRLVYRRQRFANCYCRLAAYRLLRYAPPA